MSEKTIDPMTIKVVDHLVIRDKDTQEVFVNKRDHKRDQTKDISALVSIKNERK